MKLIVNADDFGLSKGINYGILEAHLNGIVTSTTLMITMPEVEHAISISKDAPNLKIGLHLNITLGNPITNCRSLVKKGNIFYKPSELPNQDDFKEEEIYEEFKAQHNLFIKKVGKKPTHFDSHLYAHQRYPKAKNAIIRLAKEVNLPVRGITTNGFKEVKFFDFFKANSDVNNLFDMFENKISEILSCEIAEIMVHPAYMDEFLQTKSSYNYPRILELEILTDNRMKKLIKTNNIELISYDDERLRLCHE